MAGVATSNTASKTKNGVVKILKAR